MITAELVKRRLAVGRELVVSVEFQPVAARRLAATQCGNQARALLKGLMIDGHGVARRPYDRTDTHARRRSAPERLASDGCGPRGLAKRRNNSAPTNGTLIDQKQPRQPYRRCQLLAHHHQKQDRGVHHEVKMRSRRAPPRWWIQGLRTTRRHPMVKHACRAGFARKEVLPQSELLGPMPLCAYSTVRDQGSRLTVLEAMSTNSGCAGSTSMSTPRV